MSSPPKKMKMTVSLSIDVNVWPLFKDTCDQLGLTPSHMVEEFMRQQLVSMQHTMPMVRLPLPPNPQEPDHA